MIFIKILFWLSVLLITYTYILYPVFLIALNRFRPVPEPIFASRFPGVSVIIAAYNEQKDIAARIENLLELDYPRENLEIIIASDGSSDKTNEIVRQYESRGVKLFDFPGRRGKVNVLNEIVPQVMHPIVAFSDANSLFKKDALKCLVRNFQDEKVGCVCGLLRFVTAEGTKSGELEGVYWRFETMLKKLEGKRGALLGANGAIFAIRKELFIPLPSNTIVEDFVLPMKILERGYKVIFEPEAAAVEETAKHIIHEKERRIRIGAGDFQAISLLGPMLNPRRGFPALAFWSHKVIRWCVPFFMITAVLTNLILIHEPLYFLFFLLQCLFYFMAMIGQVLSWSHIYIKFFSLCYYFVSMNAALFLGFVRFVTNTQKVAWNRTER